MKKRIMLVGSTQVGKTSLANLLNEENRIIKRTQEIIYGRQTIDTPGSYLENASMYKYLIATAQAASHVLLLVSASQPSDVYPPGFANSFFCPTLGVITGIDTGLQNIEQCIQRLKRCAVSEPYFLISLKTNAGVEALKSYLYGEGTASGNVVGMDFPDLQQEAEARGVKCNS